MRKMMLLALMALSSVLLTPAQKNYHKIEVSGGYSIMKADGILGDGDVFADDQDDSLTLDQDLNTAFPNPFSGLSAIFSTTPLTYSGKRHRPALQGFNGSVTYNFSKYIGAKFEMSGNYRSNQVQGPTISLSVACLLPGCFAIPITSPQISQAYRGIIVYPGFVSDTSQKHYNYLGGLQIKNNSTEKKIKPFAHVMAGVSQQSVKFKDYPTGDSFDSNNRTLRIYGRDKLTNTGFTMDFGGGLDLRVSKHFDIRVIQLDYNPVRIKNQQILAYKQAITGINIPNNVTFLNTADPNFTQYSNSDVSIRSRWQNNFRVGFGIVFH